jgi:autotransporter-associated beta strand protein
MKTRNSFVFGSLLVFAMNSLIAPSHADTTWDGGGADTNINTAGNWNDDSNPTLTGGASTLTFGTGGSTAVINTDVNVAGIVLNRDANFEIANGAGSLTVGTGGITVTLPNTTARTHTISESSLTVNGDQNWSVTNNTGLAQLNVSSAISGSSAISKTGSGTLVLTGTSSSYSGILNVNQGTLQVSSGASIGSTTAALNMGTGSSGTLGTVGNLTINEDVTKGAFAVRSNTSNTTTAGNIGQLVIATGKTLTVSSLNVGVSQGATSNAINTALSTGSSNAGTLTVSGDVTVGSSTGGTGNRAITVADLSGLANFNAGSGSGNFRVGYGMLNRATMTLASTANVINVATISVGETVSNGNSSENNILNLGTGTNALQANTIQTGTQKASGVIQFAHATNGSVVITGAGGNGVSNIIIGNQNGSGGYQSANLNNGLLLAGHNASVSAGTVNVARRTGASAGNAVISALTFDTGTFTTTGNVTLAQIFAVAAQNGVTGTFTLGTNSASTGSLTVGTSGTARDFVLADNRMITNSHVANGSFIINGGTATIHGNILDTSTTTTGTSTTTLTLDGGTLDMTNGNIGGDGSSGNRAITNLNFRSGTLRNVAQINNGAGLTKTSSGVLTIAGTSTYTGATNVSEGKLIVNGSIASTSVVVAADATLGGSGTMGSATLSGAGMVGPGNSPGILTTSTVDVTGGLDFNFEFNVANGMPTWNAPTASGNDVLRLTGGTPFTGTMNSTNIINIYLNVGSLSVNDVFTGGFYTDVNADFMNVLSGATFNFFLKDGSGLVNYEGNTFTAYSGPLTFDIDTVATTANFGSGNVFGTSMQFTAVPESSVTLLGGLSAMLLLRRRRVK